MFHRTATVVLTLALLIAVTAGRAQATLTTIGTADFGNPNVQYNLIYDNASPFGSIVWLDYTHDLDVWGNQVSWASGLNGGGSINYHLNSGVTMNWGGSSWRLPSTVDSDSSVGFNPPSASSEMAHLYYTELGNIGYQNPGWGLSNTGDFKNLLPLWYWSGTENANDRSLAWYFGIHDGGQNVYYKSWNGYALAVRPGQLESAAVPEPSTLLLLGGGLAGLVFWRKRKGATRWVAL
jgi:hypothetical protein